MPTPLKDILLVGFGAVGVVYALVLERSGGARVTAVARSNYDAIKEKGIDITSGKYGHLPSWRPYRLCSSLAEALDRPYQYVVVITKAVPEISPTSKILSPLLDGSYAYPQPVYVLMQNGLGIENDLYDAALKEYPGQKPRILSCVNHIFSNLLSPNEVQHGDFERVEFGVYKPGNFTSEEQDDEEKALLSDFGGLLKAGGSVVTAVPEIQRYRFRKNVWNVCFSPVATLSGFPIGAIFQHESVEKALTPILREIMLEYLAVGRALGFDENAVPTEIVDNCIRDTGIVFRRPDSRHKASMLLDYENGRPMEVEVIIGDVVRKARRLGVVIPRIETLYAILSIAQNQLIIRSTKLHDS